MDNENMNTYNTQCNFCMFYKGDKKCDKYDVIPSEVESNEIKCDKKEDYNKYIENMSNHYIDQINDYIKDINDEFNIKE